MVLKGKLSLGATERSSMPNVRQVEPGYESDIGQVEYGLIQCFRGLGPRLRWRHIYIYISFGPCLVGA